MRAVWCWPSGELGTFRPGGPGPQAGTARDAALGARLIWQGSPGEGTARLAGPQRSEGEEFMVQAGNGMPACGLGEAVWHKSSYSNPNGNCVEVAALLGGAVALRNSRHPVGPALIYAPAEITSFIRGIKDGQFDDLVR
jgi:hypothetical protein